MTDVPAVVLRGVVRDLLFLNRVGKRLAHGVVVDVQRRSIGQVLAIRTENVITQLAFITNFFRHFTRSEIKNLQLAEHVTVVNQGFLRAGKGQRLSVLAKLEIPHMDTQ